MKDEKNLVDLTAWKVENGISCGDPTFSTAKYAKS